jgi:hypothetical protein
MVWNPEIWVCSIFDEESRDFQISRFVDESRFARQRKIQWGASVNTWNKRLFQGIILKCYSFFQILTFFYN